MTPEFKDYCERLFAAWRIDPTLQEPELGPLFQMEYAPEPYFEIRKGKQPLHMLLTNPGAAMEFQHRSNLPNDYLSFAAISQTVYLSEGFRREGGANAYRRLMKSLAFAEYLGFDGLINVETIPFHSANLSKQKALTLSCSSPVLGRYQQELKAELIAQPVLMVAACGSKESISTSTLTQSAWLAFQMDVAGINPDELELEPLTRKGEKVTSALLRGSNKYIVLTMGSNNLPSLNF
jgi:hypothetical protein